MAAILSKGRWVDLTTIKYSQVPEQLYEDQILAAHTLLQHCYIPYDMPR